MGQVVHPRSDPFDPAAPDPEVAAAACCIDGRMHGESLIVVELHCPMRMMACHQVERDDFAAAARADEPQPFRLLGRPHQHQPAPADRPARVRALIDELNVGEAVAAAYSPPPCVKLRPESDKSREHHRARLEGRSNHTNWPAADLRAGRRRWDRPSCGGMRYRRQSRSCSAHSKQPIVTHT